jgi:hypothetical protein
MALGVGWRVKLMAALGAALLCAAGASAAGGASRALHSAKRHPRVLLVGTYRHHRGSFKTIQAAVDAARPGDWILVGPGDYHERADHRRKRGPQSADSPAGVIIAKRGIHLRGMNRNRVVVDGTRPGKGKACSRSESRQDLGVPGGDKTPLGRNGILVYKADNVSVENLTVCNFLGGAGSAGNEIWWNGGDGSGKIGMRGFRGTYLNATSTYFKDASTSAGYGLFSSNSRGPGVWDHTYASNFDDADYYIGACAQVCNQIVNHAHAQYAALGYSGTNSGGRLLVENSEFDHNKDGFDTNSQNNDDSPSPQDGACPSGGTSPITHTHSCWVFTRNYVHDNNNPNVPSAGTAAAGPVGTGMSISGARDNTVVGNRFENNGAWGIILVPYPDTETPPPGQDCQGGVNSGPPGNACLYDDWGNAILNNRFKHNGFFGNDTNSDFGEITATGPHPTNCFHGNTDPGGVTSSPSGLQQSKPACNGDAPPDPNPQMTNQVVCDSQFFAALLPAGGSPCPPGASYPRQTKVVMHPLPKGLKSMPHPCAGVPANAWCRAKKH